MTKSIKTIAACVHEAAAETNLAKQRSQYSLRSLLLFVLLVGSLGLLLWPKPSPQTDLVAGFPYSAWYAAFSLDGRFAGASSGGGEVAIWDLDQDNKMTGFKAHTDNVRYCGFSADGKFFLTASDDWTAAIWKADDGAKKRRFRGHTGSVNYAVLSPDSNFLLTAADDDTVRLWDAGSGTELLKIPVRHSRQAPTAFSPDSKHVVLLDPKAGAVILDLATLKPVRNIGSNLNFYVTYSPDGSQVLTLGIDGKAQVYDTQTGALSTTLNGTFPPYHGAHFSPNGKRVGAAENNGAGIWDIATGKRVTLLENRNNDLYQSPTFSTDGKCVVAIGRNGYAGGLWNAETGKLIQDLPNKVWLGFMPGGEKLAWIGNGGGYELGFNPLYPVPNQVEPSLLERPEYWFSIFFAFGLLASMWVDNRYRKA